MSRPKLKTILNLNKWCWLYIFHIIYFNLKYLPFKQAIRLPIFLYRPKFILLKGSIKIEGPISTGMIQLGFFRVPLYPDSGCMLQLSGEIIFKGKAKIGNDSKIVVGEKGKLIFGNNFNSTSALKLVCTDEIIFERNVLIGWETLILDYDFHKLTYLYKPYYSKGHGKIKIGHDTWIANKVSIYKDVSIPAYSVIGSGTILTKSPTDKEYCLIASSAKPQIVKEGVWFNCMNGEF